MLNRTLDVPVIFLAGLCWLWLAMRVMDFGVQWQSVSTVRKRPAKAVLTGATGYSAGRATRQGSSSLTRFTGQSAITFSTCRR